MNGPFGNRFPYTNFHEMNLDWIIQIAKDFLDQYTHIQDIISQGEESLDNKTQEGIESLTAKKNELEDLLQAWYDTHSTDIANQLTQALADFETAAASIAASVIETIPADYSALSAKVAQLAGAPRDLFSLLTEHNYNINFATAAIMDETSYGITVTNQSNVFNVNGTATGNVAFALFNSRTKPYQFPFKAGRTYNFSWKEVDDSTLITKVVRYKATSESDWTIQTNSASRNNATILAMPNSWYEFEVCLIISSGTTYTNKTIEIKITNQLQNMDPLDKMVNNALLDGVIHFNEMSPVKDTISLNFSGLNITNDGYNINVVGTCSSTRAYDIITDYKAQFFKPGTMIKIIFDDDDTNLTLEVKYRTTGSDIPLLQTSGKGTYFLRIPSNATRVSLDIVVFNGTTYNADAYVDIISVPESGNTFIVDQNGNGDFITIKSAVEVGCSLEDSTVYVNAGTYNLVDEFGESFLDGLSDADGYYGMMLYNNIHLIFSPEADVFFDYEGVNTWIIQNFSPFNTGNRKGFTIEGLVINARNCRYIIHDDPRPGTKTAFSRNIYKNCFFTMFPSPDFADWPNHQIIGGGFSDQTEIVIESCRFRDIFTDDVTGYAAVSYHNSTSGNAAYKSTLVIKDCIFETKNQIIIQGYGSSEEYSQAFISGNLMGNAATDIIYDDTVDNITVYRWNNHNS